MSFGYNYIHETLPAETDPAAYALMALVAIVGILVWWLIE